MYAKNQKVLTGKKKVHLNKRDQDSILSKLIITFNGILIKTPASILQR